jgi:glutathione S-transferase
MTVMQKPLLYTYRRCPYAMRARMALLVAGIDFDAHEVSLRDKPSDMLALSPKGSVPVMLLPSGQVLEQSWDIMHWALTQQGASDWWVGAQTDLNARLEITRFLGGEQPCAMDIAIFPFVRQFAGVEPDWFAQQTMPSLQRWLANWLASDLFVHCMLKLPSQRTVKFPALDTGRNFG